MDEVLNRFVSVVKDILNDNDVVKVPLEDTTNGDAAETTNSEGELERDTIGIEGEGEGEVYKSSIGGDSQKGELEQSTVPSSPPSSATLSLTPTEQFIDIVPLEGLPVPARRESYTGDTASSFFSPALLSMGGFTPSHTPPSAGFIHSKTPPSAGYTPSLDHQANPGTWQGRRGSNAREERSNSSGFLDRGIEFIKREFDSLRLSLGSRPVLTHTQWFELFNSDGQMLHTDKFYRYLDEYDWPPELLQDGWKYLFEYYETCSNRDERILVDATKTSELDKLKHSWSSILGNEDDPDAARARKLIYLINKDVPRTDRDHPFYILTENSDTLRDLLVTFCFANPDTGYVQGMNEVLSLFLITLEDAVAAYWGFSSYILKNKLFFNTTGLLAKLNGVAELVNQHDPELYSRLQSLESSDMLFTQRWILLGFKRECKTFEMSVKIFTMINSVNPTHYIQLHGMGRCELLSLDMFLVVAVLISHRSTLLSFRDQTDLYTWTGNFKLTDMAVVHQAKELYDEWAHPDEN